jgi:hypothetical protein
VAAVAALFVRADSVYKGMPNVDAWDVERDARKWPGGCPVIAHPPCRAWGSLAHFAKPRPDEKELARWSIAQIRRWGGVLEHPASSGLWADQVMAEPGTIDAHGGRTIEVDQFRWGHMAEKLSRFYVVGLRYPALVESLPPRRTDRPAFCIGNPRGTPKGAPGWRPELLKADRERTPPALAAWLVATASGCRH